MRGCARSVGRGVLLTVSVALNGCGAGPGAFARVGDTDLDLADLQSNLHAVTGSAWQDVEGVVAVRLTDQYLDQEVVAAAASRRGRPHLPLDPGARTATVRSLLPELCGPVPVLDAAAVAAEVDRRLAETRPARAHVRQMLLDTLEQAREVRARLAGGEDFVELSRKVSHTPNAASGGELGFIAQGTLTEELDAVIFTLGEGEISEPVEGPTGYHIFQVLERVSAGPPRRTEVELVVARELTEAAAKDHDRACVMRLAGEVGVEVYGDHLWFEYRGRYSGGTS